jgi:nicotinamide-nucleotide amidase
MHKKVAYFIRVLKEKGLTVALAESMTCGLATHKLSTSPGTSEVFKGSVICYTPEVKKSILKVTHKCIDTYTCESQEVTDAIVKGLRKIIVADIYAGITGLASAGGSETKAKPVGTVFFSINYKNQTYRERKLFKGTPLEIRTKACMALYEIILKIVKN